MCVFAFATASGEEYIGVVLPEAQSGAWSQ